MLAEGWTVSGDGKTYAFRLRQGVKFHNGDEFDAEDVVYTLNWISDPKNAVKTQNNVNWIVEYVSAPSQIGTHMDGLNHLHIGDRAYNGHRLCEIIEEHGTNRLGIETLPQVVTRGLLLDIAAVRDVTTLGPGDVITPDDAENALARAGLTVEPGDAVLFHTGWGRQWAQQPLRAGPPPLGP